LLRTIPLIICVWLSACGTATQPESNRTVAAYEVPLPSQAERERFLSVLTEIAKDYGMHVDAATQKELEQISSPSFRITMNASVYRWASDDESMAFVMNQPDHPNQVWISFPRGKDPHSSSAFREATMKRIVQHWPQTLSLPIMPSGAIPFHRDMIRTPTGYVLKPSEAHVYALRGAKE